jgi:hypothetical protein
VVFASEAQIAALLAHIGVERHVDSLLRCRLLVAANPPHPSDSASEKIGNESAVAANQGGAERSLDRKKLPFERKRTCGKARNYRFLAQELAVTPGAPGIA